MVTQKNLSKCHSGQVSHFPKIVRHFHNPTHSRVVDFKGLSNLRHAVAARCAEACAIAVSHSGMASIRASGGADLRRCRRGISASTESLLPIFSPSTSANLAPVESCRLHTDCVDSCARSHTWPQISRLIRTYWTAPLKSVANEQRGLQ